MAIELINDGTDQTRNYRLQLDHDWLSNDQREGILFIHGFDHDLKDTIKR